MTFSDSINCLIFQVTLKVIHNNVRTPFVTLTEISISGHNLYSLFTKSLWEVCLTFMTPEIEHYFSLPCVSFLCRPRLQVCQTWLYNIYKYPSSCHHDVQLESLIGRISFSNPKRKKSLKYL